MIINTGNVTFQYYDVHCKKVNLTRTTRMLLCCELQTLVQSGCYNDVIKRVLSFIAHSHLFLSAMLITLNPHLVILREWEGWGGGKYDWAGGRGVIALSSHT